MAISDKHVLVITSDFGVEEAELRDPTAALRDAGAQVTLATPSGDSVQAVEGDKDWTNVYPADGRLGEVKADDFDLLVIPGGTVNADTLRIDDDARSLVQAFADAGKPLAAICHGPWILVDTELAAGKTMTSYISVRIDLQNAGATWVDKELQRCDQNGWTLLTSRNPGDLEAFGAALVSELSD